MNSEFLVVIGANSFSIKLAHAKAVGIGLHDVSTIDIESCSFKVEGEKKQVQLSPVLLFIQWCERLTKIEYNAVELQVIAY